jgi:hypothetical protein
MTFQYLGKITESILSTDIQPALILIRILAKIETYISELSPNASMSCLRQVTRSAAILDLLFLSKEKPLIFEISPQATQTRKTGKLESFVTKVIMMSN